MAYEASATTGEFREVEDCGWRGSGEGQYSSTSDRALSHEWLGEEGATFSPTVERLVSECPEKTLLGALGGGWLE